MATSSIREQIIAAIITRLADVRTTKGYNTEAGRYVNRAEPRPNWDETPFITVYPGEEEAEHNHGAVMHRMAVTLIASQAFGTSSPSTVAEYLHADMIECMTGLEWSLGFTSGGTYTIAAGNTVTGATSKATAYVEAVSVSSGSWAGGDAVGTLTLRRKTGTFQAENLKVGANTNVATITGEPTGTTPVTSVTSSLADRVIYTGGGVTTWPAADEVMVGVAASFAVDYYTVSGDPYHQP